MAYLGSLLGQPGAAYALARNGLGFMLGLFPALQARLGSRLLLLVSSRTLPPKPCMWPAQMWALHRLCLLGLLMGAGACPACSGALRGA